jgi:glycosyltransferase involved in cell wall biosynthesis
LKVRIIPCGIDLERFTPLDRQACLNRLGWAADRFHVLFPSNAGNPVKRPALAGAAVAAVNRLGVPAEIHYLRGVSNAEVPVWVNASDVLLLTSLHEGSPTIVKEALACRLPVVSVNVGDVEEQIRGVEGCHLASADADTLAARLLAVHTRARRLSPTAKVQELSLERIALHVKRFYDELAAPVLPAVLYESNERRSPCGASSPAARPDSVSERREHRLAITGEGCDTPAHPRHGRPLAVAGLWQNR